MNNKVFNIITVLFISLGVLQISSCKKDNSSPEAVEASFDFDSTGSPNKIKFWATGSTTTPNLKVNFNWYLNGTLTSSDSATEMTFDFPATYYIQLVTRTAKGGTDQSELLELEISSVNKELTNNTYLYNLCVSSDTNIKKWVLSNKDDALAIGPSAGIDNGTGIDYLNDPIVISEYFPENYLATSSVNGDSAYYNYMAFELTDYYKYKNKGPSKDWVVNWVFANNEFGHDLSDGQNICLDITGGLDTAGYYALEENEDSTVFLAFSGKNFMLYYEGKPNKTKYQVVALYNDLMVIRRPYFNANREALGYRYLYYVPLSNKDSTIPDKRTTLRVINPPNGTN